jgi:hypothetical protein
MDQDLRSRIKAAAQERGIDPEIAVKFAQAESSLNPNAKAKTSSASGLYQVINKTWKEYGGGDKRDVDEQIRVGTDVIASNQEKFKRKFNREPSAAELYAYHVLGPTGAPQLLRADPDTPMEKVVSPEALKANSVWKGKTVGQVLATYEKKVGGSQKAPASTEQRNTQMRPTNYSFDPLTRMDLEQLGPNYQAAMASIALADTNDSDVPTAEQLADMEEDQVMAQDESMVEEEPMMSTAAIRDIGNTQSQPILMAKGGEARKMMDAVYRADGSPEYGEISMGDFSGDTRQQLKDAITKRGRATTKEDLRLLKQIPVQTLSNLESVARGSIAGEIGGWGDMEAGFRGPRADSQAFPTRDDPTAFFSNSGTTGKVETTIPQTQEILDEMPRRLTPTNERSEGFEEVGKLISIGPAAWAVGKVAPKAVSLATQGAKAADRGIQSILDKVKSRKSVTPPVNNAPTAPQVAPQATPPVTNLRQNAVADVTEIPENLGVSRYLMPKDFVGGKAVALDAPYPHFVSKLDQFTAALPGAVTKGQYLGSLKGKFRDYEILRAEEALAGLDANAKLKPTEIADRLRNTTPVERLKTYIDEPITNSPHHDFDNPHNNKPVGIVNLMTDAPVGQRTTAKEATTVKRLFQGISVGEGNDQKFTTAIKYISNSDMAPDLKVKALSALEDAKAMTKSLEQDTAKISRLTDDLLTPFYNKQREYEKLQSELVKKEKLSPADAKEKAYQLMRSQAADALRKEGYDVSTTIDQIGSVRSTSPEFKQLQEAVKRVKSDFNLNQTVKKGEIANRFHDATDGTSLFNAIETHLLRKNLYEGQHPSLSKQGEVPVGFSRFVDNVVNIPGRGKTEIMHVIDLQSDLYDDLMKHGGKHTSPRKDSIEGENLRSSLIGLLEKSADKVEASGNPSVRDYFMDIPDYLNNALSAAKEKYNRTGTAINADDPEILQIKNTFNLNDKEMLEFMKGIQRKTLLSNRIAKSEAKNVSEHSYNIEQVFPGMEKSPQVVQQMLVKNAIMGALRRGKQGITFPGAESDQAQLYEKLPNNLRQVIKDLGPGFELVPNIVQDTNRKGKISNWGIVWDPETAQNVLKSGVRFNKGGLVEKNHDDNRRFL